MGERSYGARDFQDDTALLWNIEKPWVFQNAVLCSSRLWLMHGTQIDAMHRIEQRLFFQFFVMVVRGDMISKAS